ncbi:lysophospholipid acyltransferase family protein [Lachnoclostridium sp. MSJ-17]|uniref:lysophospholipid acyltransferase family protein n=1 Tax=Lachnoclostridium sp. MSJ-17 TaxID=2841516 RepID=UPI001C1163D5|nr:lysophospholipid acyltransferase family protein [Lachnoclostridium sp. MSJ-17]MBU5461206.1 1-acyl-sn-glycerol-3-phosphate acyltransferase [Lachnoclostridium sp. MSJ-17]
MAQNKVLYTIGKGICMPIFKLLYRFKTVNADNIPSEGGVIIASNHIANSDPPLMGLSSKRRMYFMAKVELFKNKFFGALIRALGAFPVERGAGDGKAIKTGEDLIREGNVMTIFIEGGRTKTGELMRPRSGCALVAQQMQVPVVPACITIVGNPKNIFAKRVVEFGKPLTPQQLGLTVDGGRRELKDASNMIMGEIKKMRERALNEYKKG